MKWFLAVLFLLAITGAIAFLVGEALFRLGLHDGDAYDHDDFADQDDGLAEDSHAALEAAMGRHPAARRPLPRQSPRRPLFLPRQRGSHDGGR